MTETEPKLVTPGELLGVQRELERHEPIFHTPLFGSTRDDFDARMDIDYWQVGASGRRYSRQFVLDVASTRPATPDENTWRTEGFHCRQIAPDNFLATYTLYQGERVTRRVTLWRRTPSGWRVLYHQGTVVADRER